MGVHRLERRAAASVISGLIDIILPERQPPTHYAYEGLYRFKTFLLP